MKTMLLLALTLMIVATSANAQTKAVQAEPVRNEVQKPSDLKVKEIRRKNRLDRVVVKHPASKVDHYYDIDDPSVAFQDDGLGSRPLLRTWKFGKRQ